MVTEYQAKKLSGDMRDELGATLGVALKYSPGALILFGFSLAGLLTDPQHDGARGPALSEVSTALVYRERASIAETRRVMRERRERVDAGAPAQSLR